MKSHRCLLPSIMMTSWWALPFFCFMIYEAHQGKGLGRQAMVKILEFLRTFPQGEVDSITLLYEPTNEVARGLYASLGFVETGHIEDGEVVARLGLHSRLT
ncbi:MAG: GNAT family N-acetyltransferase [Defluviitaleaceae bacterium]|nr:GNAT family N-acetyltransferase [Defluviitaleaceae bacterium]